MYLKSSRVFNVIHDRNNRCVLFVWKKERNKYEKPRRTIFPLHLKLKRMECFYWPINSTQSVRYLFSQTDALLCHCVCQFLVRGCVFGGVHGFFFVCDFMKSIHEFSRSDILLPKMYPTCIIPFAIEYLQRMLPSSG